MKKTILMIASVSILVSKTNGQDVPQIKEYLVPSSFQFDYKVVYQINEEDKNTTKTMTYYFTKNSEFMGMEPPGEDKKDLELMVSTKDGTILTFSERLNHGKNQKLLTVMNMRSMMKGAGEIATAIGKSLPVKDKNVSEKKKPNEMDNFVKTGKTKQVFGYTADEYSKEFNQDKNGKKRSGTMSIWYAKVDFDPQMMFSMGMGNMAGAQSKSIMQQSHSNNMLGIGITQKNYLLIEMYASETGGKSGSVMKVVSIEKITFNKSTEGYVIKNFSGMSMKEMLQKEMEEK